MVANEDLSSSGENTRKALEEVFSTASLSGFGETFLDRLSEDVTFTATGTSPLAGQYHGKAEYREQVLSRLHDRLATPMRPQLDQMVVDGEWAAVRFHTEGVRGTNGADASMQYCWVIRVSGDRIVEVIGYYDTEKMVGLFG
ncbi:nuclear transport factor 2 family protein [Mycolicibacterium mengxianglii]|uniref:nuclear transport factor 2 family protein n=1 Tax=Mycolicibacterium mengxianglii TaxID=2736649 RepID=UPI0018D15752|nr:nuclear transport factor 2 family protein [Mycolicibacterium mengxianglii]